MRLPVGARFGSAPKREHPALEPTVRGLSTGLFLQNCTQNSNKTLLKTVSNFSPALLGEVRIKEEKICFFAQIFTPSKLNNTMKLRSLTAILAAVGLALGATATLPPPSWGQALPKFVCQPNGAGTPTTYAIVQRYGRLVRVPVIMWFFREAEKTPYQRCLETSANFQEAYRQGILNYINAGIADGKPVICTTSALGGDCQITLFTLRYQQDAAQVLQHLRGVRKGAAGPLLESSADEPESGAIDMNEFLQTAPAEEVPSPSPQQAGATREPDVPPSPPDTPPSGSDWLF